MEASALTLKVLNGGGTKIANELMQLENDLAYAMSMYEVLDDRLSPLRKKADVGSSGQYWTPSIPKLDEDAEHSTVSNSVLFTRGESGFFIFAVTRSSPLNYLFPSSLPTSSALN